MSASLDMFTPQGDLATRVRHDFGHKNLTAYDIVGPTGAITLIDHVRDGSLIWHYYDQPAHTDAVREFCDVLPGQDHCWSDYGFMAADEPFMALRRGGPDAIWPVLSSFLPGRENDA